MRIEAPLAAQPSHRPSHSAAESENELAAAVRRAQQGDLAAFEVLYRATSGRIFALCLRICADRARAEDLTQEVYIRAWRKLSQFRGDSAFASWLYRLAINVVYSDLRRTRMTGRLDPIPDSEGCNALTVPAADPVTSLTLEQAIAGLPEGARAVLVMHDVEGFLHQEIADRLGIAVGTSKAQLHRARRMLRKVV